MYQRLRISRTKIQMSQRPPVMAVMMMSKRKAKQPYCRRAMIVNFLVGSQKRKRMRKINILS